MGRPPKKNDRCPFKDECEMKCEYKNKELECDYYRYNSCPGKEIADQEDKREQYAAEHYTLNSDNGGTDMIIPALRTPPADKSQPVTDKYIEAFNLNAKILIKAQDVQRDLFEMCTGLKQMRDDKLYKELGYSSFEEYVEAETGFKRSQVYNYIAIIEKLPSEFVQSIGQIGMTKLTLLASLNDAERAEITEKTDVESTSVRELKAEIEKLKKENAERQSDNMSLSRQLGELQASYIDVQDDNDELKNEIAELKSRPPKQVIIEQKEKTPANCVTYEAYEKECRRYQDIIDGLESDNLKLTRKAHAAEQELEAKSKEAPTAENEDEIGFSIRLDHLNAMLAEFTTFISDTIEANEYKRRLYNALGAVCNELNNHGRKDYHKS